MNGIPLALFLLLLAMPLPSAWAQAISKQAAVALAEKFVRENGYTDAAPEYIKQHLDFESIEWADSRNELLKQRRDTLLPKAIGAKRGARRDADGWSIAFDFTSRMPAGRGICRVVTMSQDGSDIRIQHVDGVRQYFAGFD